MIKRVSFLRRKDGHERRGILRPLDRSACRDRQAAARPARPALRHGGKLVARGGRLGRRRRDLVRQHRGRAEPAFATEPCRSLLVEDRKKFIGEVASRASSRSTRRSAAGADRGGGGDGVRSRRRARRARRVLVTGAPAASAARSRSPSPRPARASPSSTSTRTQVEAVVAAMEGGPHLALGRDLRPIAGHARAGRGRSPSLRRPRRAGRRPPPSWSGAPASFDVSEADWDIQHDVNLKADVLPQPGGRARDDAEQGGAGASSISPRRAGRAAASAARSPMPRPRAASSR